MNVCGAMPLNRSAILEMAKSHDVKDRQELAASVGSICLQDYTLLNDHERSLFTEIMLHLLDSATVDLKKDLAIALSEQKKAPRPLMEALAHEEFSIAEAVLSKCNVLKDKALIDVIRHRTTQHQLAIACRKQLSEQVSDMIVEQGNPLVITELLKNKGAKIGEATLRYLVDQSKKIDDYRNPLLGREDLLPEHAATMYQWVSETLQKEICKKFNLKEDDIRVFLDKAMASQLKRLSEAQKNKTEDDLVALLDKEQQLTVPFMIRCLKEGEIALFEAVLAHKLGVSSDHLPPQILQDRTLFTLACKGIDLSQSDYLDMVTILQQAEGKNPRQIRQELKLWQSEYRKINRDSAQGAIKSWQHRVTQEDLQ
jgi:uncharacterized protein (DUF2336 family)